MWRNFKVETKLTNWEVVVGSAQLWSALKLVGAWDEICVAKYLISTKPMTFSCNELLHENLCVLETYETNLASRYLEVSFPLFRVNWIFRINAEIVDKTLPIFLLIIYDYRNKTSFDWLDAIGKSPNLTIIAFPFDKFPYSQICGKKKEEFHSIRTFYLNSSNSKYPNLIYEKRADVCFPRLNHCIKSCKPLKCVEKNE